jgi:hypothetical protein
MARTAKRDEWGVIEKLLPSGWEEAARKTEAFQRVRYTQKPAELLRVLLLHAASDSSLRETTLLARAAKISTMSQVALFKRLKTSGKWLTWMCRALAVEMRPQSVEPGRFRLRAVDGSTVQGPAAKGIDWRLHFAIDLMSLNCDWFELTSVKKGEALWRVPMQENDVILADRYYMTKTALDAAAKAKAFVLIRMRWMHLKLRDMKGQPTKALELCRSLRVGHVGDWQVEATLTDGSTCAGRVVATKLPAPIAARAERRVRAAAKSKKKGLDKRTIAATRYVIVFTTLSSDKATGLQILELYRARWQIELVFKRLKQLLRLGKLPHKNRVTGKSWILSKLLLALLLEKIYRNANALSPWGYELTSQAKAA